MNIKACTIYDAPVVWVTRDSSYAGHYEKKDERQKQKYLAAKIDCCNRSGGCEGCGFGVKEAERRKALLRANGAHALCRGQA